MYRSVTLSTSEILLQTFITIAIFSGSLGMERIHLLSQYSGAIKFDPEIMQGFKCTATPIFDKVV